MNRRSRPIAIHWFRQDLRLSDNPALTAAAEDHDILPVFILDTVNAGDHFPGAASRWWLHHSLNDLNRSLDGQLRCYRGDPEEILRGLIDRHSVAAISWNRCYEPWRIKRDKGLKAAFIDQEIEILSHNGSLLWEPWDVLKDDKTPYRVFTPYYKNGCLKSAPPRPPLPRPDGLVLKRIKAASATVADLDLLPKIRWDKKLEPYWEIGEAGARDRLNEFLDSGIEQYREGRDFPAQALVSRLSPYLHFGEISPHQIWNTVATQAPTTAGDSFLRQLGWREFSTYLLFHFPDLPKENFQKKFDAFPWIEDSDRLELWQRGKTGVPLVDAGMRELWETGVMHNRVRMVTASFLIKNLLQHWRNGERWFWDCLVDADLANNSAGWQWVAGSGADAAPYFRIFNPVTQGKKFDPGGEYIRKYVPELENLPLKYLFAPWEAPKEVLAEAGIRLGRDYPLPIVDLKASRARALEAFKEI